MSSYNIKARQAIIEYLTDMGGIYKKDLYSYGDGIVFETIEGLNYDLYEDGFYKNCRALYAIDGNCGCLVIDEIGEPIEFGNNKNSVYFLIRNTDFIKKSENYQ